MAIYTHTYTLSLINILEKKYYKQTIGFYQNENKMYFLLNTVFLLINSAISLKIYHKTEFFFTSTIYYLPEMIYLNRAS